MTSDLKIEGRMMAPLKSFAAFEHLDTAHHLMIAGRTILHAYDPEPEREGLVDTPYRMKKAWDHLFSGYKMDPAQILCTDFEANHDQMVALTNIEFFSMCEHHVLPFYGVAHVAYIPKGRVVGISKLARLVECFARRLQIQERMTDEIADTIMAALDPLGVAVRVEAKHLCMVSRGVEKKQSFMSTTALRGAFLNEPGTVQEFYQCLRKPSSF